MPCPPSTPARAPYRFEPKHTALLLIDMQRGFLEAGGSGAVLGNDVAQLGDVAGQCGALRTWARSARLVHRTNTGGARHRPVRLPTVQARGRLSCGIGDPGPLGHVLVVGVWAAR